MCFATRDARFDGEVRCRAESLPQVAKTLLATVLSILGLRSRQYVLSSPPPSCAPPLLLLFFGGGTSYSMRRTHTTRIARRGGDSDERVCPFSLGAIAAGTSGARRQRRSRYGGWVDVPAILIRRRGRRGRFLLVLDGLPSQGTVDQRQSSVCARRADWCRGWWMGDDWRSRCKCLGDLGQATSYCFARPPATLRVTGSASSKVRSGKWDKGTTKTKRCARVRRGTHGF